MASDNHHEGSETSDDGTLARRRYIQGIAVAGSAIGLGGLATSSAAASSNGTVEAEFCGDFSPGPQRQQCIACVEELCEGEEVNPLDLETGLTGRCFEPEEIPEGADFVTLKAGTNCYVAPVNGENAAIPEFCVPEGAPDVSNATFYRCGGEPTPDVVDIKVTCKQLVVTTENIADGETLTATVTFVDEEGMESDQTFMATVEDGVATFEFLGLLDPVFYVLTFGDVTLDAREIEAKDAPCAPEPPSKKERDKKKGEYEKAKREYEKYKKKYEKGEVKKSEYKEKRAEYEDAKREYERCKKKHEHYHLEKAKHKKRAYRDAQQRYEKYKKKYEKGTVDKKTLEKKRAEYEDAKHAYHRYRRKYVPKDKPVVIVV